MTDEIKGTLRELRDITDELKKLNKTAKEIRERKKELEAAVIEYLTEKGDVGIKYENFVFMNDQKETRKPKKKKEKEADAIAILRKFRVNNAAEAYAEMMDAMKGEAETIAKLKIKGTKDN